MNRERYHQLRRERHALGKEASYHRGMGPGASLSSAARIGGHIAEIDALLRREGPGGQQWRIWFARCESRRRRVLDEIATRKRAAYWDAWGAAMRARRDAQIAAREAAAA